MIDATGRMPWRWVILAGGALGVAYTLSPLTICFAGLLVPLWRWASKGLPEQERRWLLALFGLAVALRVAAIAGLFLTADPNIPYATFFGDEEFFKRRTTWLRNVGAGIPISTADFIYTFDQTGDTSYLYVLAYVQALFGLAPYGVHLMNTGLSLSAVLVYYRLARRSFGGLAALMSLAVLWFLPSLFSWSISALKEPLYGLLAAVVVAAAVRMVRTPQWGHRILAAAVVVACAWGLQSVRAGGAALVAAGVGGGLLMALVLSRPRLLLSGLVVMPFAAWLAFSQPAVQTRVLEGIRQAAYVHWGHINTPGFTYKLLDPPFYVDRHPISQMTGRDAAKYVVGAVVSYVTVPLPWQIESRAALAFLPEQMVWYVLVLLVPIGVMAGLRRDVLLTSLLVTHAAAAALMVALSGGNVGTLVRHRGLALPYLIWLSGLGAVEACRFVRSRINFHMPPAISNNKPASKVGLVWL